MWKTKELYIDTKSITEDDETINRTNTARQYDSIKTGLVDDIIDKLTLFDIRRITWIHYKREDDSDVDDMELWLKGQTLQFLQDIITRYGWIHRA